MRLTIERGALLNALGHVTNVVERRTTVPILSNVLIEARDGVATFAATDLDIEVIDGANADVEQVGSLTVPAHTLYDIVRKLPEGSQVKLELANDSGRISITSGRSKYYLPVLPASDFPSLGVGDFDKTFEIELPALSRLIDKTKFAISTEETRYYLNGIYFHGATGDSGPCLRAVATDGHRLAQSDYPMPEGANDMAGIIIPRKTILELRRLLESEEEVVEIATSESKIRFSLGRATLTSKVIDGTFPDYERVIPKENPHVMTVDNSEFARAVDRVATMAVERLRPIKLALSHDNLTLTFSNPEAGEAREEVEVQYDAPEIEIGFNAKYLLDIAGQVSNQALFYFRDSASPTLVKDATDPNSLYVLMPLRV
ncbi:DNA polymerase III subunit beta [Pseudaquidulcibacter saccharophilus]|uniref:DNA polymerase III subunit beta n=1 Tax=Pseudaquidulcibacter saccharophilus TaxID=2831900 RepID=UPI001EFEF1F6|nr:DNA polymerase III subunit beta [Pseudaquidulcibacter saccharophilus]